MSELHISTIFDKAGKSPSFITVIEDKSLNAVFVLNLPKKCKLKFNLTRLNVNILTLKIEKKSKIARQTDSKVISGERCITLRKSEQLYMA